ncbi:hypothetical protein DPEC_G00067640 [Dallia pectoralis]|uniref:Uncharacterized protein n=1 Tax=Dallia pectoralis TaxID=75939 RepID=A0ACC2H1F5_DALPE|nr:hypothetical protein DPEC_G00067640 [Dallia pectoralis]
MTVERAAKECGTKGVSHLVARKRMRFHLQMPSSSGVTACGVCENTRRHALNTLEVLSVWRPPTSPSAPKSAPWERDEFGSAVESPVLISLEVVHSQNAPRGRDRQNPHPVTHTLHQGPGG